MRGAEHLEMESEQSGEDNTYANLSDRNVQKMKKKPKAKDIPGTHFRVIWTLVVLLILAVLIVAVLSGLLFNYCSLSNDIQEILGVLQSLEKEIGRNRTSSPSNDIQEILGVLQSLEKEIGRNRTNIIVPGTRSPLCEEGWMNHRLKCYYASSTITKSWTDSKTDCENKDAQLVVINNEREMNYLLGISQKKTWWIGLRYTDGSWKWVDGSSYEITPKFWIPGEPNNNSLLNLDEGEDCVDLRKGEGWNDAPCSILRLYICEKEIEF